MVYYFPDHAEHLHASWLVWQGEVPYRDFFEHHHPLLWYIAAPMVALFYKNVMIFYVARLVNASVYDFYKLDDEIFDKYYKPTNIPDLFMRKDAPELKF